MTFRHRSKNSDSGFTLVEILMVLGLVAILSVAGISVMTGSVDESRYDATVGELRQIRSALIGDTEAIQGGARSSFGYLGDLGALPTSTLGLTALITKPAALPAFAVNTAARIGLGWNGPYLNTGGSGGAFSFSDKWGRPYVYTPGANATIVSLGADGVAGGTGMNQDITMTIPTELQTAVVYGFLSSGGGAYNGAFQAEINFPNGNGALAQTLVSVAAGAQGAFQFTNIPLGPRSVTIYVPTKAAPTSTLGPVNFVVDKARFLLPTNLVDLNPSGGGGGGSSGTGGCTTNTGRITDSGSLSFSIGTQISFRVNISAPVSITKVRIDVANNAAVNEIYLDGTRYRCTSSRTFAPCPGTDSLDLTLNQTMNMSGNSRGIDLVFGSSVNSMNTVTMDFTYAGGCDRVTVPGLF
jgi:general secretion pathway protein G